jgi:uncharacterized protein (DUF488 family)
MTTVFTIGHSNLSIEAFFALLDQHQIALLVDVRTSPYSRYVPQFNREPLAVETTRRGIAYATWVRISAGVPVTLLC